VRLVQPSPVVSRPRIPIEEAYFPAKTIIGWEMQDDFPNSQDHEELGLDYRFDFDHHTVRVSCASSHLLFENQDMDIVEAISSASEGDKLWGWPRWIQGAEYPKCPICNVRMENVFQLDSEDNLPFMFGDVGCGHITQCPRHKDVLTFAWACS
jgi:hypothetical protein